MKGAEYQDMKTDNEQTHSIVDFLDQINKLPEGKYKFVDGRIVKY